MTHRKDRAEERAIALLREVIEISSRDRDALPGSAMKKIKDALVIMKKRRTARMSAQGHLDHLNLQH